MPPATRADWKTLPLPDRHAVLDVHLRCTDSQAAQIRAGLIPERMEDKWFIYVEGERLFLHRSWTGFCVFTARLHRDEEGHVIDDVRANRDPDQYRETDDGRDAALFAWLVDTLLLGGSAAFPGTSRSGEEGLLAEWSMVGRAMFGQGPGQDDESDDR